MLKNHVKTVKNFVGILATQENAPVETTVETTHIEIIEVTAVTGESKAPHSTITIGLAQNVKIQTLLSAKFAIDVKHPGLVGAGVPETTAVVQTDDHNETVDATSNVAVDATSNVAATTGKKSTTITIGHAENATTPISPSDKSATDVKHLALVAVEADQVVAEMAAVDTAEETVVETDAAAAEAEMAAVDTAAETVVETDAAAAETVVITIVVLKATTQIIAMQRASAQDTLTIGDQTTSNRGSPTDTTIDWRSTT